MALHIRANKTKEPYPEVQVVRELIRTDAGAFWIIPIRYPRARALSNMLSLSHHFRCGRGIVLLFGVENRCCVSRKQQLGQGSMLNGSVP